MQNNSNLNQSDVFVSYSSRDREHVLEIVKQLQSIGITVWLDRHKIDGGQNYGEQIVQAIRGCKVLMLMCSNNSMRSREVKQEIQLAWNYQRPYLPLMLEGINYSAQVEYWLIGHQWIEVLDKSSELYVPQVMKALRKLDIKGIQIDKKQMINDTIKKQNSVDIQPIMPERKLEGLREIARFTDEIWPVPAERIQHRTTRSITRGLGAPQEDVRHGFALGSRVCLAIESNRAGHLLLIDEGPEGIIYCLCPSRFAPKTYLPTGKNYLPQERSRYDSFVVTGKPGREHLLAIITDEPLNLDWMTEDPKIPARVLKQADIETLLDKLQHLEGNTWTALSTYFDVVA